MCLYPVWLPSRFVASVVLGKNFTRNLTEEEIIEQVMTIMDTIEVDPLDIKKHQIMFMSMGEPFLNYENLREAILTINETYPWADLLVSTVGPQAASEHWQDFVMLSKDISQIGIQFSVHESHDYARDTLIPFKNKLNLKGDEHTR